MTIFGTPEGTPLNSTGFQGTQPGNAVGATLSPVNPGVGMFPPNSNTASGDSVMASASRATLPLNVHVTNFGATSASGLGTGAAGGRTPVEAIGTGDANGVSAAFVNNGGSANAGPGGGNSLGAGGFNQTNGPTSGESSQIPASAPVTFVTIPATPVYRG